MPRYRKKIWSGAVLEIQEYFSPRKRDKSYQKGLSENLSTAEQKKHNLRMARVKLTRLINTNFTQGDLFLTLTFAEKTPIGKTGHIFRNFMNRLRRFTKKKGIDELKYIYVLEEGDKRLHIHMLLNDIDLTLKEITNLWGQGRVLISIIEPGSDYTGLSFYITKDSKEGKRWSSSRNLKKPKEEVKEIGKERKLKAPKGYKVVEDLSYYSEYSGYTKYMKAIKIGGTDYGEGKI